jgi:hypothetical protein
MGNEDDRRSKFHESARLARYGQSLRDHARNVLNIPLGHISDAELDAAIERAGHLYHIAHDEMVLAHPMDLDAAAKRHIEALVSAEIHAAAGQGVLPPVRITTDAWLAKWKAAWPEVADTQRAVREHAFRQAYMQEPPPLHDPVPGGTVTGRMSSRQLPPPHRFPPRRKDNKPMPKTYTDSNGGEFTPGTAYLFRDGHLINAVRKLRRENHDEVPADLKWMVKELDRRGLREVAFKARNSLQQQAIGLGYSGGPDGVRRVINELRDGAIHDKMVEISRMSATTLSDLAKTLNVDESLPKQKMVEDILSTMFPITETEAKRCHVWKEPGGVPVWVDASGRKTRADQFGNVYLTQAIELLSERFADNDIPPEAVWLFEEFVKRGLHRKKNIPVKTRHLPLISELEDRLARTLSGEVEVPLSDLVKMQSRDPKENLFSKLRARETEASQEALRSLGIPKSALYPTKAAEAATLKEKTMSESTEELQAELEALEERKAALQAKLNEKKGLMGHPTAQMVSHGVIDGSKMLLATEAMDAVQALARKIALKFFIPEGHEAILDTDQGQMFVDMAMPIAIHLAASQGLFGPGSEFAATTAGYAFTGNWFKHGKNVTSKVKEVMGEFAGELNQLKELGKELMGLGQSENLLSEVMDFTEKAEELSQVKEKAEAKA